MDGETKRQVILEKLEVNGVIKWGKTTYKKDTDGKFKQVDKSTGDIREDLKIKE
jgi:hypothetical protein